MRQTLFEQYLARKRREYGEKFDDSKLPAKFVPYYNSDQRVKVVRRYDDGESFTRFGRVSATTGWRPAFLLMHRVSDIGSSDVLSEKDEIVAVQEGRTYRTIKRCECGLEWGHHEPHKEEA